MAIDRNDHVGRLILAAKTHRRFLWSITAAVLVYTLLGFFLAPWLLKKNAIESVQETLGARLQLEKVAINPFVFSLRIEDLELDSPTGAPFARADEIFVNFQLSSLFRWAWTFDEFRVDSPEIFVARDARGTFNFAFLTDDKTETEPAEEAAADKDAESSLIRLLIFDFAINDSAVNWRDEVPVETVETRFGPVNIQIAELNTLPRRAGRQEVVITTASAGTLSWTGSLQLNPLNSVGHASVKGSHFPLTSAYLRHKTGFDIVDGLADVELDYGVTTGPDGSISATVDNFDLAFQDVLVHTFSGAAANDAETEDREVLSLPSVRLAGGTLRWPERQVSLASFAIDDAVVSLLRDETGKLNVVRDETVQDDSANDADEASANSAGELWQLTLDQLAFSRLEFGLVDLSVEPNADVGAEVIRLEISDISNAPGAAFPTSLSVNARGGGTLNLDGVVTVLPAPLVDFDISIADLVLAGAHPYIKPLADVNLDSGALNLQGHLRHSPEDALEFSADLDIVSFLITETDEGSRLGSWERLDVDTLALSLGENRLEISEIRIAKPYGDIVIAEDGTINLGRIERGVQSAEQVTDDADNPPESSTPAEDAAPGMDVTIGRVVIDDGTAAFADFSLPLPFAANITQLNGNMTTIATASSEPSTVTLEGAVDDFGLVRVSGSITPLEPPLNTDLKVVFQNVAMPKFSAYTVAFAGREIANGKLDLDLGYRIEASNLAGENNIVMRDFELGEKVPHPGAMSLPLGLAVALLKDTEGKIDIDLPVRGNVDDPEFSYGRVVVKALVNLVLKIVTSPFALLANLVGGEAADLEYIDFVGGRADLTPPELEKIEKLAAALAQRPQLAIEVAGAVDRDTDHRALQAAKVDVLVAERVDVLLTKEAEGMYAKQQRKVLEQLYTEQFPEEEAAPGLAEIVAEFTSAPTTDGNGAAEQEFDELAYVAAIRKRLIETHSVTAAELDVLANERAANVVAAVVAADPSLASRVISTQIVDAEAAEGEPVRMPLAVTAQQETDAEPES